jgi:putative endonuclease
MATGSGQKLLGSLQPRQLIWKVSDAARQLRQRHVMSPTAALGRRGEDLAHRYLRHAGLTVLARNYRPRGGESEVDIVARDGDTLIFVEVKARASADFGSPDRAIDGDKQKRITRAARQYALRAGVDWSRVRFDTISIVFTNPPSIVHQQDAFFEGRAI